MPQSTVNVRTNSGTADWHHMNGWAKNNLAGGVSDAAWMQGKGFNGCPSRPENGRSITENMRKNGYKEAYVSYAHNTDVLGVMNRPDKRRKITRLKKPSHYVGFLESENYNIARHNYFQSVDFGFTANYSDFRHAGAMNACMIDGHVETFNVKAEWHAAKESGDASSKPPYQRIVAYYMEGKNAEWL